MFLLRPYTMSKIPLGWFVAVPFIVMRIDCVPSIYAAAALVL